MTEPAMPASGAPAVAIVVSRYNASVTDRLLDGARHEFDRRFPGADRRPVIIEAPGAFELTALCLAAARHLGVDGVVALGCVIKGETPHDRVLADAVAGGLTGVTLATGVPVAFGVLTTDSPEQALERAGGRHGNKGREAMAAMIDSIASIRGIRAAVPPAPIAAKPDKASAAPARPRRVAPIARKRSARRGSR